MEIIGDQSKVSESQFTGAVSNLWHLSNSISNQQELPQTSIKRTQVSGKASPYPHLLTAEIQQTVLEQDWGSEEVVI